MTRHLTGPQEVCEILGISRQRLQQLAARPDFPEPVAELALGRVWETDAIRAWAQKTRRLVHEDESEDGAEQRRALRGSIIAGK